MSVRAAIATQCSIGGVKFWASTATGGGSRSLAVLRGIGEEGAPIDDHGEEPEKETIRAVIGEDVYLKLDAIKRAGKTVTYQRPLFGVWQARIASLTYEANPKDMVDVTIVMVEDGPHANASAPTWLTLPEASDAAKGQAKAFDDAADDVAGASGVSSDLLGDITDVSDAWDDFDSVLDDLASVVSGAEALGAAFADLGDAVETMVNSLDTDIANGLSELVDFGLDGAAYEMLRAASEAVEVAMSSSTRVWRRAQIRSPLSLSEVALEYLGADDDEQIEQILAANPSIIDLTALDVGVELFIPVDV